MPSLSRRKLIRDASLAGAVLLGSNPIKISAEKKMNELFHVFAFQWKPRATDAQKEKATRDIRAFQGVIPGLLQTHVGPNISPRGKGYTYGGIMQFTDQAALDAYVKHPAHQALLEWLVPLIDAIELDVQG
jgi:antibiotic biosynthesis monooxygenase (ABM) superfamily enzyme